MATPTPFQLAAARPPTYRKVARYARDLYNFAYPSVSQGANNPPVMLPCMGPHAAGAVPPSKFPQIVAVDITVASPPVPVYGVNFK